MFQPFIMIRLKVNAEPECPMTKFTNYALMGHNLDGRHSSCRNSVVVFNRTAANTNCTNNGIAVFN